MFCPSFFRIQYMHQIYGLFVLDEGLRFFKITAQRFIWALEAYGMNLQCQMTRLIDDWHYPYIYIYIHYMYLPIYTNVCAFNISTLYYCIIIQDIIIYRFHGFLNGFLFQTFLFLLCGLLPLLKPISVMYGQILGTQYIPYI